MREGGGKEVNGDSGLNEVVHCRKNDCAQKQKRTIITLTNHAHLNTYTHLQAVRWVDLAEKPGNGEIMVVGVVGGGD